MSKSVYVRVVHELELLRYVLGCAIERQLEFPTGINELYCYHKEANQAVLCACGVSGTS